VLDGDIIRHAAQTFAMDHHTTLSRTASRASHRSRNSNLSRTQSLVKKNIELIDLKPADVLIERFVAWKVIVNQLTSYFEVCKPPFHTGPSIKSPGRVLLK